MSEEKWEQAYNEERKEHRRTQDMLSGAQADLATANKLIRTLLEVCSQYEAFGENYVIKVSHVSVGRERGEALSEVRNKLFTGNEEGESDGGV